LREHSGAGHRLRRLRRSCRHQIATTVVDITRTSVQCSGTPLCIEYHTHTTQQR
jgi:hypothetical protein